MREGLMRIKLVDKEGVTVFSTDLARTDAEAEAKDADESAETLRRAFWLLGDLIHVGAEGSDDLMALAELVGHMLIGADDNTKP